ncbi:MAG: hypothetical protein Q8S11_09610 [Daejeonella sp.]|uniref:hypothetical protein n=1 Tax=Daejeonella sp. TaxID=2805397 RepID=UPI0027367703|nr:hypothetical protein [Daejeonella sp.]MDP3468577.1 hypothetical protein [Daejeonella sp.]
MKKFICESLTAFRIHRQHFEILSKCIAVLFLFSSIIFTGNLFGAIRTSSGSGNWNSTATWGGNPVPVAGDDVTISAGHTVTITANAACTSITFSNNSTLSFSGAFSLDVSGEVTMPAPGNNNPITFALGTGTATIGGLFTMNGGSGNANRRNDLTISTGTLNLNGGFTTATTRCNVIFSGAGVLNISGATSANAMTLTASTGTVNYTGNTAQNIWGLNYYNLGVTGAASKTCTGILTVSNALNVDASAILALSGTGTPLNYSGTISGTGKVLYSGASAQTISGLPYYDLEFSGAGTKTIAAAATVTVNNNWIVGSATNMNTTAAALVTGDISGSGSITMGSGTITLAGSWTNNGTFTGGTGTVIYNGGTQIVASLPYYKLELSNSGEKTLAATTTVSNTLTVNNPATLGLSSFTLNLPLSGTPLIVEGSIEPGSSTVNYSGTAVTNIAPADYYNLDGAGGDRVLPDGEEVGIAGAFTPGAGAYTVTGSVVNFNGSGPQTIPAFTFNNVILSGSGEKEIPGSTEVTVTSIEIQDGPSLEILDDAQLNIVD